MKNNGILQGLKFVHMNGTFSCSNRPPSNWGCGAKSIYIIVTDVDKALIMPERVPNNGRYVLPGYHSTSKTLVLIDHVSPMYAYKGQVIKVMWGVTFKGYVPRGDDIVCAKVYAMLT